MKTRTPISDEAIEQAYAQGKAAVIALFHKVLGRIQVLEDRVAKNSHNMWKAAIK